ncbi:MAG: TlpA family protein disulfide reductase [Saprospiraceae bacterium]|nr:TlpA family protein disulfide reductase [Saprospiraceae bacterium]
MRIAIFYFIVATFSGCIVADQSYTRVAPGVWRGVLELEHFTLPAKTKKEVAIVYDQFKPGELPFNFEVTYLDEEKFYIEVINGAQRIRLDSIQYGRDKTQARDTMNVWFPEFQSYIHAEIRGGVMQGYWRVTTKDNYQIPFYAHAGRAYRFTNLNEKPENDLSGNWATRFGIDKNADDQENALGEFKQTGNQLTATFRTETGDYGYLEGTVQGRKFWLSTFDGAHAFLFSGGIQGDTLQGEFLSGHKYKSLWSAWKDANYDLRSADSLTQITKGGEIAFKAQTPEGKTVQFPSAEFDNKIKIFTISGTWCPNCKDELLFLNQFMNENPDLAKQISVVVCSFERDKDPEKANRHIQAYKKKLGITFDMVYAGKANKDEASNFFKALDHVMAFPTMIILDKKNQVRKIHTGFDGPATSRYESFRQDFKSLIQSLQ